MRLRLSTVRRRLSFALAVLVVGSGFSRTDRTEFSRSASGLTEGPRLAAIYDTILQAQFARVDAQLTEACPPAPAEACKALATVSMWWQILIDPTDKRLDKRFNELAASAIAASDAWTRRQPQNAESWFYLAGSYAPLLQWRILRGERASAARDGNRIREALERALALDPTLDDAYFGIGLYHYYADVVPGTIKFVRWLMFLPGGDRVKGMREMLQARERGELLSGEADFQLHLLYLWYEHDVPGALALLERLDRRYPSNPLFLERIADVYDVYVHDHFASAARWRELLDRVDRAVVVDAGFPAVRAKIGYARQLDALFETDRAIDELASVVETPASQLPYGALAQTQYLLGAAYDRLGRRDLATRAYSAAVAAAPSDDPLQIREKARAGLRVTPDPRSAEAYRTSLEGWRAFERGAPEAAEPLLARAVELAPADMVSRYRYARLLEARGDRDRARDELERIVSAPSAPAIVLASAYVEYAAALERRGDRMRALSFYQNAAAIVGGDPRARDRATRAIKRLAPSRSRDAKFF